MLIFNEKKYALNLIKNNSYNTIKNQGKERCILVRYLNSINKSREEIKKYLSKIPMSGGDYLSENDKNIIYDKIIDKSLQYNFIDEVKICIYKDELNVILSLPDENAQNLLFIYLVYYKWASQISYLQFYSKKNNIMMVVENNSDLWKLAGLNKLRVSDRYRICNYLYNHSLYSVDNFKSHNYIYLPFARQSGEIGIEISNYDNILGEFLLYKNPDQYKRCSLCGMVIKKTRSPKKYCDNCAYEENIRKTKENKKRLKTQTAKTVEL